MAICDFLLSVIPVIVSFKKIVSACFCTVKELIEFARWYILLHDHQNSLGSQKISKVIGKTSCSFKFFVQKQPVLTGFIFSTIFFFSPVCVENKFVSLQRFYCVKCSSNLDWNSYFVCHRIDVIFLLWFFSFEEAPFN